VVHCSLVEAVLAMLTLSGEQAVAQVLVWMRVVNHLPRCWQQRQPQLTLPYLPRSSLAYPLA
jgi:hypothetical protein